MTLDEMEALAHFAVACEFGEDDNRTKLGKALRAVLPVVRIAMRVVPDDLEDGPDWDDEDWLNLGDALDQLRREMGEG